MYTLLQFYLKNLLVTFSSFKLLEPVLAVLCTAASSSCSWVLSLRWNCKTFLKPDFIPEFS